VILGFSALAKEDLPATEARFADLSEVEKAAQRASELTSQLLAFSRKQMLSPRVLDLNPVLTGLERMLKRLLGEDVRLSFLAGEPLDRIHADPGQLEQVIVNLAVNARDAMPAGGNLTIETSNAELDEDYAWSHPEVTAGAYVVLSVSDTGEGMDRATQARIFEPFFTTKEQGKGTGLGLATVYGIVRQSGGHIEVESEPGQGTTFRIYLPRTDRAAQTPALPQPGSQELRGSETVLLVEDEDQVRALVRSVLHKNGYHVLEAQNGGEAFLLCEKHPEPIQLLLTDLVMPRMNGRELAERLAPLRPTMKVLYMSGYTEDSVFHEGLLKSDIAFLPKPLSSEALLRKVRHTLAS
jgi:two-component system cell cycle sensor histidine kinase/response regulator CckA